MAIQNYYVTVAYQLYVKDEDVEAFDKDYISNFGKTILIWKK